MLAPKNLIGADVGCDSSRGCQLDPWVCRSELTSCLPAAASVVYGWSICLHLTTMKLPACGYVSRDVFFSPKHPPHRISSCLGLHRQSIN